MLFIILLISILCFVDSWIIYKKMGYQGWEGIIPIYSSYVLCEELYGDGWKFLFSLIPFYNIYFLIKLHIDWTYKFHQSTAFAVGMLFFPFIFQTILAFGDAQYGDGSNANTSYDFVSQIVDKTKEIAITTNTPQTAGSAEEKRLNNQIDKEKKAIETTYYEIGKKYVELHASDKEEAFAELLNIIEQANQKIKNYHKQIQVLKGIRLCPKCGAEVSANSAFCNNCGTAMPKDEGDLIKCQNCGKMIPKDKKFCAYCGTKVVIPAPAPVEQKPVCPNCGCEITAGTAFCCECGTPLNITAPVEEKQPELKVRKCPNCGNEIEDGLAFCMECGTKL